MNMAIRLALSMAALAPLGGCTQREAAAAPETRAEARATPTVAPPFQVERSAVHSLPSERLGRTYQIYVKTPPGYDRPENAGRRYPAVYLTDGPYAFQVASGVTRVPFNQGKLEELILVGLSYAEGEDAMDSRGRDYTPYVNSARAFRTGEAAAYLQHIESEVFPMVEGRYHIDPARRTLSGQSFGGLFGLWTALTRPELFSSYLLTSPSIWWVEPSLLETEAVYAAQHDDLKARIYLAVGSLERPGGCRTCKADMVGDQEALVRRLRARDYPGLRIRSDVIPGTIHEMTYPVGLVHGLQWLFPDKLGLAEGSNDPPQG